jgi:hypothetical protein
MAGTSLFHLGEATMTEIAHRHPVPQRASRLMALGPMSLWPLCGLAVLILIVAGLALRPAASEPTVRTADGTVWTVSDASAYVRGRLDDEAGRRYCEVLQSEGLAVAVSEDQEFLDQLTKDLCRQRLALPW